VRYAIFGLIGLALSVTSGWSSCPTAYTGSYCELPDGYAGQSSMFFCTGVMTGGPYFDSASLTFTPSDATRSVGAVCGSDENNSCYYCYLNTITVTGKDCNGNTQTIKHTTCCEYSP
jgi:hypothetical protein